MFTAPKGTLLTTDDDPPDDDDEADAEDDKVAAQVSYWRSLSDQELESATLQSDDPNSLDNILLELPPGDETPIVEFGYNTGETTGLKVRCIHCKYDNHNRGFVLRFENGGRILVGKDCGKKIYHADFGLAVNDHNYASKRQGFLRRRSATLAIEGKLRATMDDLIAHRSVEQYKDLKFAFNREMRHLVVLAADACQTHGGSLVWEERVRDKGAEEEAEERAKKRAEDAGKKYHPPQRPDRKYKYFARSVGVLSGQSFFRLDRGTPKSIIESAATEIEGCLGALKGDGLSTAQLQQLLTHLGSKLDEILEAITRLEEARDAFELINLQRLAEWGTIREKGQRRYEAGIGRLKCIEGLGTSKIVAFPAGYVPPAKAPFVTIRSVIAGAAQSQ